MKKVISIVAVMFLTSVAFADPRLPAGYDALVKIEEVTSLEDAALCKVSVIEMVDVEDIEESSLQVYFSNFTPVVGKFYALKDMKTELGTLTIKRDSTTNSTTKTFSFGESTIYIDISLEPVVVRGPVEPNIPTYSALYNVIKCDFRAVEEES